MKIRNLYESHSEIVYRGLSQEFDTNAHAKSGIIFVTPSKELAAAYSDSPEHVYKFNVVLNRGFNFGFRTLSTEVKFDEIKSRLQRGIMSAYTDKAVDKNTAAKLFDEIDDMNIPGYRKVWMWYMEIPVICDVLRGVGYDHIVGLEGLDNDTMAYGLLYPNLLKLID